jgi:transcription elongation factor GreA
MNEMEQEYREEKPDDIVLTREGHAKLAEELDHLKNAKRWEVAKRLEEARAHGDITENSEYEDAKHEQAFVAGRIIDIERILENARIIKEDDIKVGVVSLGITVVLLDLEMKEEKTYRVVSSAEARGSRTSISDQSPVGKAILGRKEGETVEVPTPAGIIRYEILKIER